MGCGGSGSLGKGWGGTCAGWGSGERVRFAAEELGSDGEDASCAAPPTSEEGVGGKVPLGTAASPEYGFGEVTSNRLVGISSECVRVPRPGDDGVPVRRARCSEVDLSPEGADVTREVSLAAERDRGGCFLRRFEVATFGRTELVGTSLAITGCLLNNRPSRYKVISQRVEEMLENMLSAMMLAMPEGPNVIPRNGVLPVRSNHPCRRKAVPREGAMSRLPQRPQKRIPGGFGL